MNNKARRIPLWLRRPPFALGDRPEDKPFMELFPPDKSKASGAAMLVLPGGSYTFLSEKSGAEYGQWLSDVGIAGFVVHYRLGPNGYRYKAYLADALRALFLVCKAENEWHVDPERVGVIGTSAGGHLASLLLTGVAFKHLNELVGEEFDVRGRPALGVLCYPVISMKDPLAHMESRRNLLGDKHDDPVLQELLSPHLLVDTETPPCFIWHTNEDEEVSAENSRCFADALNSRGIPHELHLYAKGPHRLGLARDQGLHWTDDCVRWLRSYGF